jgi:Mrp family chromosome partitioning ATPase
MLGISDSLVLLPHTDSVLFVVRYGMTHSHGAAMAMRRIRESGVPCIGALLNGINLSSVANYYYYRQYRSYAYSPERADAKPPAA